MTVNKIPIKDTVLSFVGEETYDQVPPVFCKIMEKAVWELAQKENSQAQTRVDQDL